MKKKEEEIEKVFDKDAEKIEKERQEKKPEMILEEKQVIPEYKKVSTDVMNPAAYLQVKMLANDLIVASALPQGIKNAEQAFVLMWFGREMGLTPFESVNSLYIVNGGISIFGKAVPKQMRKHGYQVEYLDEKPNEVTTRIFKEGENYKETYTFKEAQKSGYTTDYQGKLKFGWKEGINRRLKLRYGALSLILRTYIPEVLGNVRGIVEVDEDVKLDKLNLPPKEDKVEPNGALSELVEEK